MIKKDSLKFKPYYLIDVKKGKKYAWCSCNLSNKQPFCDGSHKKDGKFKSVKYLATENEVIFFCGCKMTDHQPMCDGSHSKP